MRLAVLVIVGGCGRVAFDPNTDGHDEDSDGIVDVDDVCPFVRDPAQADSDGDHVGDACDPNPATPTERIALFLPLTPDDLVQPMVSMSDGWQAGADSWQTSGTQYAALRFSMPLSHAYIEAAYEIIQYPMLRRQIGIGVYSPNAAPHYYGEVFDSSDSPIVDITHFDGATFNVLDFTPIADADFTGVARLRLSFDVPAATIKLDANLGGNEFVDEAAAPGLVATSFRVTVQESIVAVRYIAVVVTEP